ncbi:hypothetical protein BpHYR1_028904 [Brachionus plicatilis]|uniref:Uncharacterized protein n=1 Tax=Brachionus plicatilis TaxID=10195 RepID=A0A3M7RZM2_BRAPC|nr:hypothetical protein BpHYR1_028904 [Brachionus plicatilis]
MSGLTICSFFLDFPIQIYLGVIITFKGQVLDSEQKQPSSIKHLNCRCIGFKLGSYENLLDGS